MCKWGTDVEIELRRRVAVDSCIAETIVRLNEQGVHTTGCCCGHGKGPATATIYPHSVGRARELGYTVAFPEGSDPVIQLVEAKLIPGPGETLVGGHMWCDGPPPGERTTEEGT